MRKLSEDWGSGLALSPTIDGSLAEPSVIRGDLRKIPVKKKPPAQDCRQVLEPSKLALNNTRLIQQNSGRLQGAV
jgi:hypothetical protein